MGRIDWKYQPIRHVNVVGRLEQQGVGNQPHFVFRIEPVLAATKLLPTGFDDWNTLASPLQYSPWSSDQRKVWMLEGAFISDGLVAGI